MCYNNSYFPDDYIKKIKEDPHVKQLRIMFAGNKTPHQIHEYMTKHKVIPDKYCFMLAHKKNNKDMCEMIIEAGFKPSMKDIVRITDVNYRININSFSFTLCLVFISLYSIRNCLFLCSFISFYSLFYVWLLIFTFILIFFYLFQTSKIEFF